MIAAEPQHHPAPTPAAAFQAAARALIIRTLLLEEAARLGLEAAPERIVEGKRETVDEAAVRQLLEHCVPIHDASEAECRTYYDSHAAQFCSPELMEASHILFAVDPRDDEASARAQSAARSALAELSHKPALFENLARARSGCSSKCSGGRLGQLAPGDTVQSLSSRMAYRDYKLDRFLAVNGLAANATLAPGQKVKLVVYGPRRS